MEDILDPVSISVSKSSVRMTMEKLWHRPCLAITVPCNVLKHLTFGAVSTPCLAVP